MYTERTGQCLIQEDISVSALYREKQSHPYTEKTGVGCVQRELVRHVYREEGDPTCIQREAVPPVYREKRSLPYTERSSGQGKDLNTSH